MRLKNPGNPGESKVMKIVNLAGTAVMLNLLFLLACVPVVTIGPALCGLYSGVRYMIRGDGPVKGFLKGFTTRFVRMMIAGVVFTAILVYFTIMLNAAYNTWLELGVFRDMIVYAIPALVPLMLLFSWRARKMMRDAFAKAFKQLSAIYYTRVAENGKVPSMVTLFELWGYDSDSISQGKPREDIERNWDNVEKNTSPGWHSIATSG